MILCVGAQGLTLEMLTEKHQAEVPLPPVLAHQTHVYKILHVLVSLVKSFLLTDVLTSVCVKERLSTPEGYSLWVGG